MFVNGLAFLLSRSRGLFFAMGNYLTTRGKALLATNLKAVAAYYRSSGFCPRTLFVDGEFAHLSDQLDCLKVKASSASENVGDIERFIRTIKERIRSMRCMLPYRAIPNAMVVHLVQFTLPSNNSQQYWLRRANAQGWCARFLSAIAGANSPDFVLWS